jgi:hypothetical protein
MDIDQGKSIVAKDQALTYTMSYVIEDLKQKFNEIRNMNEVIENESEFYLGVVVGAAISKYFQSLILQNAIITDREKEFINSQIVNQLEDLKSQIQSLFDN